MLSRSASATAAFPAIRCRCGAFHIGRCRVKRLFSVTFPVSLRVNPRQSRLLEALRRFLAEKVPTDVAFLRHLLIFVMSQPASEKALGGPASIPCREGADGCGFSPSPSRFRYESTRVREGSWWPCVDSLPRRCRRMWLFSVTFSVSLCVNPRQSRLLEALRRFLAGKVPTDVAFLRHLLGFVMCQPASE